MTDRFSPRGGVFGLDRWTCSLVALAVVSAAAGCTSSGSAFETGGAPGTDTGGALGSSGGSGNASGGVSGTGGGGPVGTGGSASGSGGSGSGGIAGPGSGGVVGSGTGGVSVGTGGGSVATGGSSAGTGGVVGPGTGGSSTGTGGRVGTGGTGTGGRGTGGVIGTGGSSTAVCPKPAGQICHEFYASDNANNRLLYVNEFDASKAAVAGIVWAVPVGDTGVNSPRTIEIVDNPMAMTGKAVLVNLNRGFGEFDVVNGTNLRRVMNQTNVSGAVRIPNPADPSMQTTALGTITQIIIVNNAGVRTGGFMLPNGTDDLRAINRNPADGTYWFSKLDDVFQVSATGTQLWTANLGLNTKGYAVWWREGGGAYATTGEPSTVVEFDAAKTKVRTVGTKTKFPELDFFSGFMRLSNGNFVVANWLGHITNTADLNRPHIIEITPQDTIVWRWGTQAQARQITNVYVIR